ncbi:MAG TPA: proton-conducting transporter membrane subunit [Candidatus Acidoferrales bacterium]|nr:proton-conducting transporter membrane subunit [Candidatus Acidoferrales bacterium]
MNLAPLPVAIPLLIAAIVMATARIMPRWMADSLAIATAAAVLAVNAILLREAQHGTIVYWFGGWQPRGSAAIGIDFSIDVSAAIVATFVALLFLLTFIYSSWYFKDVGHVYHAIMLTFLGALCGFALTGDIFNLFVFFELMSAAAFGLCGYKIEEETALAGTINFAITNTAGAFFMLIGIALVYGKTGALNMAQIGSSLAHQPIDGAIIAAFGLICFGLAVKGAIVPLHWWLDDAHAVAPTPLCVLFSGIMVQIALFAIARIYWTMFAPALGGHADAIRWLFIVPGAVTVIIGGVMAFLQSHLKRLLAFSTVSHSGIFLCAIGFLNPLGITAMLVFVIAHGLVKASLFMGTGIILARHGSLDEHQLAGKSRGAIWGAVLFLSGGLVLAGLPPFGDFLGKALVDKAAESAGFAWLAAVFILGSALDGGAAIRAGLRIFFGFGSAASERPRNEEHKGEDETSAGREARWTMTLPALVCLLLCLSVGAFPRVNDALGLQTARPDLRAYVYEVVTLLLTFVMVALALRPSRRLIRSLRAPRDLLRALHSGAFPDYMAWMVSGAGALALAMWAAFAVR